MDINNHWIHRYRIISGMMFIIVLILFLQTSLMSAGTEKKTGELQVNNIDLLLNSGLTQCRHSQLKYIIWSEELQNQTNIEKTIGTSGLPWYKEIVSDFSGNKVLKYSALCYATCETEDDFLERYNTLYYQLDDNKTKVYLEERIDEAIDIADYYGLNGISIVQTNNISAMLSLTGDSVRLSQSIQAGNTRISIQGITKKNAYDQGKTIIALPALFEEF